MALGGIAGSIRWGLDELPVRTANTEPAFLFTILTMAIPLGPSALNANITMASICQPSHAWVVRVWRMSSATASFRMISYARTYPEQWWMWVFPGLAIFAAIMGFTFVGDALRDAQDPRTR